MYIKEGWIYYKNMHLIKYIQQLGWIASSDRSLQSFNYDLQTPKSQKVANKIKGNEN